MTWQQKKRLRKKLWQVAKDENEKGIRTEVGYCKI